MVKILTDTEMDAQKNSRVVENGDRDDQQLGLISSPSASVKQTLITRPSDQGKKKNTHTQNKIPTCSRERCQSPRPALLHLWAGR